MFKLILKWLFNWWPKATKLEPKENESDGDWRLEFGLHQMTLTSRYHEVAFYKSESAAKKSFTDIKKLQAVRGYYIWYANLFSPSGEKKILDEGIPYS